MDRRKSASRKLGYSVFVLFAAISMLLGVTGNAFSVELAQDPAPKRFKILHVMSYHSPWKWTDNQFIGFKEALRGVDVEYKVLQMDTKRNSSMGWKEEIGRKARNLIDTWKPDLVYTNDDNAQIYVTKHYVNSDIPFVFSGVNASPEKYGFVGSKNVTGVLERPHWAETIRFLKKIDPSIKRMGVVLDNSPTFVPIMQEMQRNAHFLPEIEFVSWDVCDTYKQFKSTVIKYQDTVDAYVLLSAFTLKNESGNNVPYEEVYEWNNNNSRLPDVSFWKDRIHHGNMLGITVSAHQQGYAAGKLAREILIEGKAPSSLPIAPSRTGNPMINLARVKKLGISVDVSHLLAAEVIKEIKIGTAD